MSQRRGLRTRAGRRSAALVCLGVTAFVHLVLPAAVFASAQTGGSVRVRVDQLEERPFLPGTEALARWLLAGDSGLKQFHVRAGTYDQGGPTPEAVAAFIQNTRVQSGEQPPHFEVLKVYSIVRIDDEPRAQVYAVRYQTNLHLGVVRNLVFNDLIAYDRQTRSLSWGGVTFIDPIYALRWPAVDPSWGTVVGGMAAVAAAAVALAAALAGGGGIAAGASTSTGRPEQDQITDPKQVVGHLLQLSTKRLDLCLGKTKRLDASVWRVKADGSYETAPDCEILMQVPEGFASSATQGWGAMAVNIQQIEPVEAAAQMVVYVNGPHSGTTDFVDLFGSAETRLDIDVDSYSFLLGTRETASAWASVANPGDEPWTFTTSWRHGRDVPIRVVVVQEKASEARVELTEAGTPADVKDSPYIGADLCVFARCGQQELERQIPVFLNQEGLFVANYGSRESPMLSLVADGKQEARDIDFRVLRWNPETRRQESDTALVSDLIIVPRPETEDAKKALEVAELTHELVGIRSSNLPTGTYRFQLNNEVPGNGSSLRIPLDVAVKGREQEKAYSRELILRLDLAAIDPEVVAYEVELERCQIIIDKHVPEHMRNRMQALLDDNRIQMGADGLYQLRHDIWNKAREAWLAEGESYRRHAQLLDWCVYALEWVEWAGDKAFELVVKKKLLTLSGGNKWIAANGTRLATFIKKLLSEALGVAISERRSPVAWLNERVGSTLGLLSRVMGDLGTEAWNMYVHRLTPARLDEILRRRVNETAESRDAAARIYDAVVKEIKSQIWNEGKKALKSKLEEYEIEVVGNGWRVRIPVWTVIWVFEQTYSFYDNYANKKMSFLQAARATAWSVADDAIWGYVEDVALKKRWDFDKGGIVHRGDEDFFRMLSLERLSGDKVSVLKGKLNDLRTDMAGIRPMPYFD